MGFVCVCVLVLLLVASVGVLDSGSIIEDLKLHYGGRNDGMSDRPVMTNLELSEDCSGRGANNSWLTTRHNSTQ